MIYSCKDNTWSEPSACADNVSCNKEQNACGDCINTHTQCKDLDYQTCSDGLWSTTQTCSTSISDTIPKCDPTTGCSYQCKDASLSSCNNKCIDIKSDSNNCGGCDRVCSSTAVAHATKVQCSDGKCQATNCSSGYSLCNGTCTEKLNDNYNCGECGTVCEGATVCINGSCIDKPTCGDGKYYSQQTAKQVSDPESTAIAVPVNAFCINSIAMLNRVREKINLGEHYPSDNTANAYIIVSDLSPDPVSWLPIGTTEHPFKGYFFGNNKSLVMNTSSINVHFGVVDNAVGVGVPTLTEICLQTLKHFRTTLQHDV